MQPTLFVRQTSSKSFWDGFAYAFTDATGAEVGSMNFAFSPRAKNARLNLPGSSDTGSVLHLGGKQYLFRFEYTRRGFHNDVRYTLETPAGEPICTADVVFEGNKLRPALRLTQPLKLEVLPSNAFWRKRFPICDAAGTEVGAVQEPRAFSVGFEYGITLPNASPPVQAFLLLLTHVVRR
jgi:hypothetical protein